MLNQLEGPSNITSPQNNQAAVVVDRAAVQVTSEALLILDLTGSEDRLMRYVEDTAAIYGKRLAVNGFNLFEADAWQWPPRIQVPLADPH